MITAALGLDVSKFNKGVADARAGINSLVGQATAFGGPIGTLFGKLDAGLAVLGKLGKSPAGAALMGIAGAAAAAGIAMNGMWSSMSRSKELTVMAEQSGLTVRELMTLQKAFGSVGLDAEAIPTIMSQLSSKIEDAKKGAGPAAEAFARLGLSVADLSGMGGLDQLKAISKALRGVTNDTERLALQRAILGRKGAMAMPALEEGKLGKAEKAVAPMAAVVEQMGGVFIAFQANIKKLSSSFEPFFLGMASQVIPTLIGATKSLEAVAPKLLSAGVAFGENVAVAAILLGNAADKLSSPKALEFAKNMLNTIPGFELLSSLISADNAKTKKDVSEGKSSSSIFGIKEARMQVRKNIEDAKTEFAKPKQDNGIDTENQTIAGIGKATDPTAGLSSLAKMGAIGAGGAPIQDPVAMRSVSIQEDIRNYMRDLVNIVKNPENLSIQSGNPSMVLTA